MLSPDCPVAELAERPRGHSSSPELVTTGCSVRIAQ